MKTLLIFLICAFVPTLLFAAPETPAEVTETHYSTLMLVLLSSGGVILHILNDLVKEIQKGGKCTVQIYLERNWPSILMAFLICAIIIGIRHEIFKIPEFSGWEGIVMTMAGYCGRSVLMPLLMIADKKFGVKEVTEVAPPAPKP